MVSLRLGFILSIFSFLCSFMKSFHHSLIPSFLLPVFFHSLIPLFHHSFLFSFIIFFYSVIAIHTVHTQNIRFQNVRFQNVRFQYVWIVRFTKRQLYKTSDLQNVRFTKRQVFKTSGCKKTSICILYLWLVEISRFCCSHVCRQSDGCVLFSILEGFFAIYHHNR